MSIIDELLAKRAEIQAIALRIINFVDDVSDVGRTVTQKGKFRNLS